MKYIRKTTAGSLVLTLAFFAGSFCLHPMAAQAMDAAPAMAGHVMDGGSDAAIGDDASVTAWNICVINCASKPAQAVAAKKFSVDPGANLLADTSYDQPLHFSASSSGATDLTGTHPPSPDILFSVFKKE